MDRERTRKIARQLNIIDDTWFQKMAEDAGFCEEMISAILGETVKVLNVVQQDTVKNLQGRSVILDVLCEMEDGSVCVVEVEKSRKHNHFKRVRYNTSCVTVNITETGSEFEKVPNVKGIYIANFDIFNKGKVIYHIRIIVEETGEECDNGLREIYVNASANDGSDLAKLMKIFREQDEYDYEKFPKISKRKQQFLEEERGETTMCEIVENYAKEYAKEYAEECVVESAKETAKQLFESGVDYETVKKAMKQIPEDVLQIIYNEVKKM